VAARFEWTIVACHAHDDRPVQEGVHSQRDSAVRHHAIGPAAARLCEALLRTGLSALERLKLAA
jgi:hypothetical protein